MRGDLSETTVADLCRGLADAEATGAVEVEDLGGEARIYFRKGDVYWAVSPAPRARLGDRLVNGGLITQEQLDEALAAQSDAAERTKLGAVLVDRGSIARDVVRVFVQEQILDAMFDLMRHHEGRYAFRAGEVADEPLPVDIPVDQLLVEVSRRQQEWTLIEEVIPHLDMIPQFVSGGSSAHAALEPDEFAVLASVDGRRSVRDLADDLGYSEFEAARIVYGLNLLGIVSVRDFDPARDRDDAIADIVGIQDADEPNEDDGDAPDGPVADDVAADAGTDAGTDAASDDGPEDDIAAALEDALRGPPHAPGGEDDAPDDAPARPTVKLHVADDLSGYTPPRHLDAPSEPGAEGNGSALAELAALLRDAPEEDDEPSADVSEPSADDDASGDRDEPSADVDAPADTDPVVAADADADERSPASGSDDGPGGEAPGQADPTPTAGTASPEDERALRVSALSELGFFTDPPPASAEPAESLGASDAPTGPAPSAAEPTPPPPPATPRDDEATAPARPAASAAPPPDRPGAALDDADFDALLNQLAGAPGGSTDDESTEWSPGDAGNAGASGTGTAGDRDGGGDVSEFLRELSRLALDDAGGGGAGRGGGPKGAPRADDDIDTGDDAGAESAGRAAAESRDADRRTAADEKNAKKRGLFGWGR